MTTAYPHALRADLQESINGYLVADPYRWLEDPGSAATGAWLTGQDVDGPIDRCRYSGVAWLPGGKAFYYPRRLAPDARPARGWSNITGASRRKPPCTACR